MTSLCPSNEWLLSPLALIVPLKKWFRWHRTMRFDAFVFHVSFDVFAFRENHCRPLWETMSTIFRSTKCCRTRVVWLPEKSSSNATQQRSRGCHTLCSACSALADSQASQKPKSPRMRTSTGNFRQTIADAGCCRRRKRCDVCRKNYAIQRPSICHVVVIRSERIDLIKHNARPSNMSKLFILLNVAHIRHSHNIRSTTDSAKPRKCTAQIRQNIEPRKKGKKQRLYFASNAAWQCVRLYAELHAVCHIN